MADGFYRFQQSGAGQFFHQPQNHRSLGRASSPPLGRRTFNNDTPSPSRSPVSRSSGQNAFNMYSHGGHQGHNMLMNGGQHHQRYGMQMPKQNQSHHPHHQQNHHQGQHNQGPHLGHQYTYSGGLSAATPHFTQSHLQNGNNEPLHDDAEEDAGEYWQQQRAIGEECRRATSPHFWARHIARDQKGITFSAASGGEDNRAEGRSRLLNGAETKRQDWMAIDFGGQGLRALSSALFKYTFLEKLYLNNNHLSELPPAIGSLKKLIHLDLSSNQLTALPAEIGMLINLEKLLVVDNMIKTVPYEMGYLWRLEIFGMHGNPLEDHLKAKIKEGGTRALINYLREQRPCKYNLPLSSGQTLTLVQMMSDKVNGNGYLLTRRPPQPKSLTNSPLSHTTFFAIGMPRNSSTHMHQKRYLIGTGVKEQFSMTYVVMMPILCASKSWIS